MNDTSKSDNSTRSFVLHDLEGESYTVDQIKGAHPFIRSLYSHGSTWHFRLSLHGHTIISGTFKDDRECVKVRDALVDWIYINFSDRDAAPGHALVAGHRWTEELFNANMKLQKMCAEVARYAKEIRSVAILKNYLNKKASLHTAFGAYTPRPRFQPAMRWPTTILEKKGQGGDLPVWHDCGGNTIVSHRPLFSNVRYSPGMLYSAMVRPMGKGRYYRFDNLPDDITAAKVVDYFRLLRLLCSPGAERAKIYTDVRSEFNMPRFVIDLLNTVTRVNGRGEFDLPEKLPIFEEVIRRTDLNALKKIREEEYEDAKSRRAIQSWADYEEDKSKPAPSNHKEII